LHLVAVRRGTHAEAALDMREVLVELAEHEPRLAIVIEGDLDLGGLARFRGGAAPPGLRQGLVLHRQRAPTVSSRPARLFGNAAVMSTSRIAPIAAPLGSPASAST